MKRILFSVLIAMFTVVFGLAVFTACTNNQQGGVSGDEVGEYYYDAGDEEYLVTLAEGRSFTLQIAGDEKSGTYVLDGEALKLTFSDKTKLTASISGDALTLTYGGKTYHFLKKIIYTVRFVTNGAAAIADAEVVNGKTLAEPKAPEKQDSVFVGWYTDSSFGTLYAFDTPVTESFTLYARFVPKGEGDEFTVKFDSNGGTAFAATTTVGGKLYNLPVPKRDGYEFAGWWVSHYNDANKLTYRYTNQTIAENLTLFAVWKGSAPLVSVTSESVSWSADGVNNSYTVRVKDSTGAVIEERTLGTTSLGNVFASKPMGEYTVEVTLRGQTTVAYYKNKALARVSLFRVEDSVLIFNSVDHATNYRITVVCGTAEHAGTHTNYDLGASTRYNFSACDMRAGGITFVVTAEASGYLASTSETFPFERTLGKVEDLKVDPQTELASWKAVDGATSYTVTVLHGGSQVFSEDIGNKLSFDLKSFDMGALTVKVRPNARGWNIPEETVCTYDKTRIAAPKDLSFDGVYLRWTPVAGVKSYVVKCGDTTFETTDTKIDLTDYLAGDETTSFEFRVQAVAQDTAKSSLWSDALVVRSFEMGEVRYEAGFVVWDPVYDVSGYIVRIDGEEYEISDANRMQVTFTRKGVVLIEVCAVGSTGRSNWASVEVTVYAVTFDEQGGDHAVSALYKAAGDPIELPDAERTGYTLAGWYTAPNGSAGAGFRYTGTVFTEKGDLKLYAAWTANKYTVSFDVGLYGDEEIESVEVSYHEHFTLPTPVSSDTTKAFIGWFTEPNNTNSIQYTDHFGESIRIYPNLGPVKLYAVWIDIFSFTQIANGYSVSKGEGIRYVTEITVPVTYNERPVTTVENFSSCTELEVVNLPETIRLISLTADNSAFRGCTALREVNIYPVEGNREQPVYESYDGAIIYNNSNTGYKEFRFFPVAKAGVYTIPDGVVLLPAGVFYQANLVTEIRVPASVTRVEMQAFRSCAKLAAITFLAPEEGKSSQPLAVSDQAFHTLNALTEITLPSRLQSFSSETIYNCNSLQYVYVSGTDGVYSSADGLLCTIVRIGGISVREIIYCPTARGSDFTVPDGVRSIGAGAFAGNVNISRVTIPNFVLNIGTGAFMNCTGLLSVEFEPNGSNALTIADSAFYGCTRLSEITLPENLVNLGVSAFGYTPNLTTVRVESAGDANGKLNFADAAFGYSASSGSFSKIFYVETLYLGVKVPEIDISAVFGYRLERVVVDGGNANFTSEDGVLYNKSKTSIAYYPDSRQGSYTVPDSVTEIAPSIFRGKTGLTQISIGGKVTRIGETAFYGCTALQAVEFRPGTAPLVIEKSAFYNCNNLERIDLPERTTYLGDSAFYLCSKLKSVGIPASVETIGGVGLERINVFENCFDLQEISVSANNPYYASIGGILYRRTVVPATGESYISELLFCPMKKSGTVDIPETVTVIRQYAFSDNDGITAVTFGSGTVSSLELESYAFYNCNTIQSIALPKGLQIIGSNTFYACRGLTEITIPNSVTSIGQSAFYGCSNLSNITFATGGVRGLRLEDGSYSSSQFNDNEEFLGIFSECRSLYELTLPARTTYVGIAAFTNTNLKRIFIPANVTEIGAYAFAKLDLEEVSFASGSRLTTIGDYAFYRAKGLDVLDLPANATTLGVGVFQYTEANEVVLPAGLTVLGANFFDHSLISKIDLPEGLDTIESYAFNYSALREIVVPASVTTIGSYGFANNASLKRVVFADGSRLGVLNANTFSMDLFLETVDFGKNSHLKEIGDYAFDGCTSLKPLTVPASVERIGVNAFQRAIALTEITFEQGSRLREIAAMAFQRSGLTNFEFPVSSNYLTLGESIFNACSMLFTVHISRSVTNIDNVFLGCGSIRKITVAEDSEYFSVKEDSDLPIVWNKDGTAIRLIYGATDGIFTLDEGTTDIGAGAFANQTAIKEIWLPRSVQRIGANAFDNCINLEKVGFVNETGNALYEIGAYAFRGCTSLTEIDLSSAQQFKTLGNYAFDECKNLRSVNFSGTALAQIGNYAFNRCSWLSEIKFSDTLQSIGDFAFFNTGFESIVFPSSLESLGRFSFQNCYSLGYADLSKTKLTAVPDELFDGCTMLTDLYLPATLVGIGAYSLRYLPLTDIVLPEGLEYIDEAAFYGCEDLVNITFPASLTTLGAEVFRGCISLKSLDFSATKLGAVPSGAFRGCTALETVRLPSSVGSIGAYAFSGCVSLGGEEGTLDLSGLILWTQDGVGSPSPSTASYIFEGCTSLKKVVLPFSLTNLGAYAFYKCKNLTEINLDSMKVIGDYAFSETGFKKVTVPVLDTYGIRMFQSCSQLDSVIIPASVTKAANYMFSGCTMLTSVEIQMIQGSLATAEYMFQNCTRLSTVKFAENSQITALAAYMFYGCTSLKDIRLPATVESLGSNIFANCRFTSLDLSYLTGVRTIPSYFLSGNSSLTSITLPAGITSIASNAFRSCTSLTEIDLSRYTLTSISDYLFYGCSKLETVKLPTTVEYIGREAFRNCTSLKTLDLSSLAVLKALYSSEAVETNTFGYTFAGCTNLTEIKLPMSLRYIPAYAFSGCTKLVDINLEHVELIGDNALQNTAVEELNLSSLKNIGSSVFSGCKMLTKFIVEGNDNFYTDAIGALYSSDGRLVALPNGLISEDGTYTMPDGVTELSSYAFAGTEVKRVILPESLTTIGRYAFTNSAITSVVIPASVTVIDSYAFKDSLLENVVFMSPFHAVPTDKDPTPIPYGMFDGATHLSSVTLPEGLTAIGVNWFRGCTALKSIDLPSTLLFIGDNAFAQSGLTSVVLSDKLTTVGDSVFEQSALQEVTVNGNYLNTNSVRVTSPQRLFQGCTSLSKVTLGEGVKTLGNYWFANDTALKTISFPTTLTTIDEYAFSGSGLESVVVPETVLYVMPSAFENCVSLRTVKLPETLTLSYVSTASGIQTSAAVFRGCTNLTSVNIPRATTELSSEMFANCTSLSLFIPRTVTLVQSTTFGGWNANQTLYFECSEYELISMWGTLWLSNFGGKCVYNASPNDLPNA